MATKIIHKKSSVSSSIPNAGDLAPGELALNLADQKIYSKTTSGTVIEMAPQSSGSLPDLNDGNIFIGNSSNQTTTASLTTEVQTIGDARYVNTTGDSMTGNLSFGDNDKAIFGAGSDLQIYHDNVNSYIDDTGTGNLVLRGNSAVSLQKYTGETLGVFNADGPVNLFYDNAQKFATTTTGVDITGTLTSDGITTSGVIKAPDGSAAAPAYTNSGDTDGGMYFPAANQVALAAGGTERMRIDSSGNLKLTGLSNGTLNFAGGNTSGGSKIQAWNDAGNANGYLAIEGYSSEYMRIDSSGNVGIGTTAQTEKLVVDGSIASTYQATNFGLGEYRVQMDIIDSTKIARIGTVSGAATPSGDQGTLTFMVNGSEKMRIDSSGNLLVGTATANTAGITLNANDYIYVKRNNNTLILDRTSTDGSIAEFRKDGNTVGSIGTDYDDIYIGNGDTGLHFNNSGSNVLPYSVTDGAWKSNHTDLGHSSVLFKDAYFSGTVNANSVDLGTFVVTETNGHLYFSVGGVNKMKLDSSGNLQVVGNVDSNATIT